MKETTFTLKDLDGLPGLVDAVLVKSRSVAVKYVRAARTVTAAGFNGAINVWRDKRGRLHAQFYRNYASLSHEKFATVADLEVWLKKWWPEMGR